MGISNSSPGDVAGRDWFESMRMGKTTGYACERKYGANTAVSTSEVVVSQTGGTSPYMPQIAVQVEAISTSANDAANGTGARTITILGLDADFNEAQEVVSMNGTSATVSTATAFIRVFRCFVTSCGTYGGGAAGTITVRASGAGTTFVTITAGANQTQTTHYCVPADKRAVLFDIHLSPETNKSVTFKMYSRRRADVTSAPFEPMRISYAWYGVSTQADFTYAESPFLFPEKTDIWVTAQSSLGSASVSAEYTFNLVPND